MSKIETIQNISDKLAASSISVVPKRCVFIRNWHSRCRSCLSACQHDAIKRSLGRLSIDSESCTDCGACVAACPTQAMLTTAPAPNEIVRQARESARRNAGSAAFICARHAHKQSVDTSRVVVLPCLNYLDEYLITGMFALHFKRVVLFTCGCEDCDVDCTQPYLDTMIESAQNVLELWNTEGMLRTLDTVPDSLRIEKTNAKGPVIKSDRREAFKQSGASALEFAWSAVNSAIGSFTGEEPEDKDRQIVMRSDERFAADSYRSVRLLTMLDRIGTRPYGATVDTRFWASVDIDPDRCRHCGTCAKMCITQALEYAVDDGEATLTFRPSLCVNCHLCKDSCLSHSMIYSSKVLADDLDRDIVKTLYQDQAVSG